MSKNKYVKRYLVEWKERNQEHWFNSSKEFLTKSDADTFIKSLKDTYPEDEYPCKLSIKDPQIVFRLNENFGCEDIVLECIKCLTQLSEQVMYDEQDESREYKRSCVLAAQDKLMTVAAVILECYE